MEKINVAGVTLQGYAQGGWQTSIYCPEVRSVFDTGVALPGVNADRYFITHSHPDHIMALSYIVGKRSVSENQKKMSLYVPEQIRETVETLLRATCQLFGPYRAIDPLIDIMGVQPGDSIKLNQEFTIQVLPTVHRGPSVGYVVEQTTRKLKPEFIGKEGREIGRLRQEGVEVTDEKVSPMLAIPGDTQIEFLLDNELAQKAKVLTHEVTYWDDLSSPEKCRAFGHTHVDEMIEHCDKFEGEALVLVHRSMKYKRSEVEEIIKRRFPSAMLPKIHVFDGGDR